jgi:hypothetical protein
MIAPAEKEGTKDAETREERKTHAEIRQDAQQRDAGPEHLQFVLDLRHPVAQSRRGESASGHQAVGVQE